MLLEQNWIAKDPKATSFFSLVCRAEKVLSQASTTNPTNESEGNRRRFYKNQGWKFKPSAEDEPTYKKVNGKMCHWCPKPHFRGKPMWAIHKPEDHSYSTYPVNTPKTKDNVDFQLQDKVCSLIAVVKQDFPMLEVRPTNNTNVY